MKLLRAVRSLAVWTGIAVATVAFGLPAIVAAFIPPRGDWFLHFARGWSRTILFFSGVRVRVLHRERLPPARGLVVVSNHESYADILVLLANLPLPVRLMAKRSIFRIPVMGWSIRAAGFVPVDRGVRSRGAATVEAALKLLKSGRSIVLFPEETRTRDGELLPFKPGAALLALRSGFPLLPVAITGTRRILPRGALATSPGRVVLSIGDPISVSGRSIRGRDELTLEARQAISALRDEAASSI